MHIEVPEAWDNKVEFVSQKLPRSLRSMGFAYENVL
jgi:hypothetical protein